MRVINWLNLIVTCFALLGSVRAMAAEETTLGLHFSGFKLAKTHVTSDNPNVAPVGSSTSAVTTDLTDAYLWGKIDRFRVYVFPFKDSNSLFSLSYMVQDDLELGIDFGYNLQKDEVPKHEISRKTLGAYVTYFAKAGTWSLENQLMLDLLRGEERATDRMTGTDQEIKLSGYFAKAAITALYPISKNAWYLAGASYLTQNEKNSSGQTTRSRQLALTLAGFRIAI